MKKHRNAGSERDAHAKLNPTQKEFSRNRLPSKGKCQSVVSLILSLIAAVVVQVAQQAFAAPSLTRTASGKLLFDDFNRASLGSSYTAEGGGMANWSIVGNRVRYQSTAGGQAVLRNTAGSIPANAVYEATFNMSSWAGLVTPRLRGQANGNNYYYFESHFKSVAGIRRVAGSSDTKIVEIPGNYNPNTDYRVKMQIGDSAPGSFKLWLNESLIGTGTDSSPLSAPGNSALWAADFSRGTSLYFDNLSVYTSTIVTVNGTFGSWALYRNDGATMVGSCNTGSAVDYATATSFPVDYANGSAAQIKVYPVGVTDCSGTPSAIFVGTPGNEIFGGDIFDYSENPGGSAASFQVQTVIANLTGPLNVTFLPDGRMLIAEKGGILKLLLPGQTQPESTPVLTLANLYSNGESGLLNVITDNNFAQNNYIYVFYSAQTPFSDRVSRFTMSGNVANPSSELVLWQDNRTNTGTHFHRGGGLTVSNDNKLFITIGDHFAPSEVNNFQSYYGKLLRINLDGSIPNDNPFYDGAGPNLDEIWALGLRNPYRMSHDSVSDKIYIGDVGELSWEEIDIGAAGVNYGWPVCEGMCGVSGMTNPLYAYSHNGGQAAVTAGFVYRGTQFPSDYVGNFFYGDYANGWIKRLTFDSNGVLTGSIDFLPPSGKAGYIGAVVDIKEGPDGSLFFVDIGTISAADGSVKKISYTGANQLPVAAASANPTSGTTAPLLVSFSSAGSFDPEAQPLTYSWNFGDGQSSTQADPQHTYNQKGTYQAALAVSDGTYSVISDPITIIVGIPPIAGVDSPPQGLIFRGAEVITYSGSGIDAEDGALPASAYSWTVIFHHLDHIHPFLGPLVGETSGQFTIPVTGHDFRGSTSFEIILTVTDSDGNQNSSSVFIVPDKVDITFSSQPPGLNLIIDGITILAPSVYDTMIGFVHSIEAPDQNFGGSPYVFGSWSDSGAQSHDVTVPALAQPYTATFTPPLDTTAPSIPANLAATAVSTSQINLSWSASTDAVGVAGYRVYRCQGSGCTPAVQIASVTSSSYQNTNLLASTIYTYAVTSYDAANNESGPSASATATTRTPSPAALIAAYSFSAGSGTALADASGNNRNGTLVNGPTWTTGQAGGALSFDGANDYVTIADFAPPANLTLEAWIYPSNNGGKDSIILGKNSAEYDLRITSLGYLDGTSAGVWLIDSSFNFYALANANQWYNVAYTFDSVTHTHKLYRNSVLVASGTNTGTISNTSNALWIGRNSQWNFGTFLGKIDNVRIYAGALTQAEIQTDMSTPVTP
jgi:glucose/arabinose dehydrogenase